MDKDAAKEFRIKDTAHITEMKGTDDLHKLEAGSQRYAIQTRSSTPRNGPSNPRHPPQSLKYCHC